MGGANAPPLSFARCAATPNDWNNVPHGAVMNLSFRPITASEMTPFRAVLGVSMGFEPQAEDEAALRSYFEFDRTICAFDGDAMIGTLGAFSLTLTVPGGTLPMAGTTVIGVLPTHRRRGVLRGMLERHFADIRARNEPLSGLWASEAAIYGRFGYGPAAYHNAIAIDRPYAVFRNSAQSGAVRMLSVQQALAVFPGIHDRVRAITPGMLVRRETWWRNRRLYDPPHRRQGASPLILAVYERDGVTLGYVQYRRAGPALSPLPQQKLLISEMIAVDDHAYAALWRFICGVDLIARIEAWDQPVDDPLPWLLRDARRLEQVVRDSLWLRIIDARAALAGRRYAATGRLVLSLEDDLCAWNNGVFMLEAGPDGARCTPSSAAPDIVLPIDTLGAAFLGGNRFQALARAGRVAGAPDALRLADAMFAWDRAPWCPEVF
jgi:predicted acetyltransferase